MFLSRALLLALFLMGTCLMFGCDEAGKESNSNKPKARGGKGEILMVIDSIKYQGPVGDALKEVFQEEIKGLVREERIFDIRRVDPRAMTRILKMAYNIVYVTSFDDKKAGSQRINSLFSKNSKDMAQSDSTLFMMRKEDEFARGQEVVYLFGNTEEQLINNILKNKDKLQNLFEVRERKRLEGALFNRTNGALEASAREKFGLDINFPASYQFVQEDDHFLWARQPTPSSQRPDISLYFYETDYESEEQLFPENLKSLRDDILETRVFGDPNNKNSFLVTESKIIPSFRNLRIDGQYAMEMRGQWKTNNISMGGSFISYAVVHPTKGQIYFMEGFLYYPNESHKAALREIEAILMSTKFLPEEE